MQEKGILVGRETNEYSWVGGTVPEEWADETDRVFCAVLPTLEGWETVAYPSLEAAQKALDEFRSSATDDFLNAFSGGHIAKLFVVKS